LTIEFGKAIALPTGAAWVSPGVSKFIIAQATSQEVLVKTGLFGYGRVDDSGGKSQWPRGRADLGLLIVD
jgi:hypothetical protein